MSRCFPFPPPGYEKKARTDDPDLLKKEKQREKKHKKEKKDKEKRENKEKKDKDGSNEKNREKKDKKEKRREKKKDKDRDKDKEKNSSSDEKILCGKSEGCDGEKTPNEKKMPGKSECHNGENVVLKGKDKEKDRNSNSGEKKVPMQFSGYCREYSHNSYLDGGTKESKFVKELGRRVGDEARGGNHLAEKFSKEQRKDGGNVKLVAWSTSSFDEGKEKKDERGVGDEARSSGKVMVQNLAVQTTVEGMSRQLEKDSESRTEGKGRTKQKEGVDKSGDKRRYNNMEKNEQGKYKDKKKEGKPKMKSEHKNIEKDKLKDINKDDHIATHNKKTMHLPKDVDKNAVSEGSLRKRKELETNGFCHANDVKPSKLSRPTSASHPLTEGNKLPKSASLSHPLTDINKLPRPTSSSHPVPGNGKILEPCQTSSLFTSDKGGAADNLKADNKDGKLNGVIASRPLFVSAARPQLTVVQTDQIPEVSMKPPHPDTKSLSQVLLVPKMEHCFNFDDQEEWLFHSSDFHSKIGSSENDELPQVWAEAMRIESADVCALPYVIPF